MGKVEHGKGCEREGQGERGLSEREIPGL